MAHPAGIAYQVVTDRIVAELEKGTVPWQQPWKGGAPANIVSGKAYRGINVFLLQLEAMAKGYESNYWMTFDQMVTLGGTLKNVPVEDRAEGDKTKSGQHPTLIVWWNMVKDRKSDDPNARVPLIRYFRVFNLDQTEGVRIPKHREVWTPAESALEPNEIADAIVKGYLDAGGPDLQHVTPEAYYRADEDLVNMPSRALFKDGDAYYDALFHELGHSTGHKSRLDRDAIGNSYFGSHEYGREELVAQMTATFLDSASGIETTHDNSVAYLASWVRAIKEDVKAVVWAAGQAQRAADLILGVRPEDAEATAGNESAGVLVEQ